MGAFGFGLLSALLLLAAAAVFATRAAAGAPSLALGPNLLVNPGFDVLDASTLQPTGVAGVQLGNGEVSLPDAGCLAPVCPPLPLLTTSASGSGGRAVICASRCLRLASVFGTDLADEAHVDLEFVPLAPPAGARRFLLSGYCLASPDVLLGSTRVVVLLFNATHRLFYDVFRPRCGLNWTRFEFVVEQLPQSAVALSLRFALVHTPGSLVLDSLALEELLDDASWRAASPLERFAAPTPPAGPAPRGTPANDTHVEQIGGVWWLVGPDGAPFWATFATSFTLRAENNPVLAAAITGNQSGANATALLAAFAARAKASARADLGFSVMTRASPSARTERFILSVFLSTENPQNGTWFMRDTSGRTLGGPDGHIFPDPFDPAWEAHAGAVAAAQIDAAFLAQADNIGYWTDNEQAYGEGIWRYIWSAWCSRAFVDWLQGDSVRWNMSAYDSPPYGAYASIGALNAAWSASGWRTYTYASFEDIRTSPVKPYIHHWNDTRVREDLYAFERVLYKRQIDVVVATIRAREDGICAGAGVPPAACPHKLLISNRFAYPGPSVGSAALRRVIDLFSVFDVIGLNAYPDWNRERTFYSHDYLDDLKRTFHDPTGRPVLIAEFGIGASEDNRMTLVDRGDTEWMYTARWRPRTAFTQAHRALSYANIIRTMYCLPWTLGMGWYTHSNQYYSLVEWDPRNCGIVDDAGDNYEPLRTAMNDTNALLRASTRSGAFTIDDIDWSPFATAAAETTTTSASRFGSSSSAPNQPSSLPPSGTAMPASTLGPTTTTLAAASASAAEVSSAAAVIHGAVAGLTM